MSVWQIRTIAVLMHFVITPTDSLIAHVNLDIKEMEETAQVIAELRAKRASGAPCVNKSTQPRKFGNHVNDRPSVRPHHRHTNVYPHTF